MEVGKGSLKKKREKSIRNASIIFLFTLQYVSI